jgi:hypothetical protein
MVRLLAFLVVLGFVSGVMMGCHAEGTVDPHSTGFVTAPH